MTALRNRLQARAHGDADAGVVLVFVILSMVVVGLFVTAGLAYAVQTQSSSRGDQDRNSAAAAAQAGIDDYLARLNRDDAYYATTDCTNAAVPGPKAPSCSVTTSPGWQKIDPVDPKSPSFHYDVDNSAADTLGTVSISSTGRVGKRTRTLNAVVGKDNSTDFLYYTDHENADPYDPTAYSSPAAMPAACNNYWWGLSPDSPSGVTPTKRNGATGCIENFFGATDVLDGAVFTNDTPGMVVSGSNKPTFQQGLLTVDPACGASVQGDPTTWKFCDRGQVGANYPVVAPKLSQAHYLTDNSAVFAAAPGCQYKGPTRIQFNSGGTMTVWSRQSTTTTTTLACGGAAPMGKIVNVPDNMVVYVRNDPAATDHRCYGQEIDAAGGTYSGGFTGGTLPYGTWKGYNNQNVSWDTMYIPADMHCGVPGNVFLAGTLTGRLTVASEGNVVVTGSLSVGSLTGRDMLGLVAAGAVEVAQPRIVTVSSCNGGGNGCNTSAPADLVCNANRRIDASIQALRRSFFVQDADKGCTQGTLTINGSIAQKWRGGIGYSFNGTPTSGYVKSYVYDKRLRLRAPPYFPYWTNAAWGVRRAGETPPQYRYDQ